MKRRKQLIGLWLSACALLMLLAACSPTATTTSSGSTGLGSLAGIGTVSAPTTAAPTSAPTTAATVAPTTAAATTAPATSTSIPTVTSAPAPTATSAPVPPTATSAPAPTATNAPVPTAPPTTAPTKNAETINNVIYTTDKGIYAYNIATAKSFELATGKILRHVVSPNNKQVAFYSADKNNKISLYLVILHGNSASEAIPLDTNIDTFTPSTEDNPFASRRFQAYSLDFSPDSRFLAYSRINPNGPSIDMWDTKTKPTEVWLADTAEQGRNIRRLAPNNDKDFMYAVKFSTDGGRVGFLRTVSFPSDVSGTVALWSVHSDGTKLTILQDGGELSKQTGTAGDGSYPATGRIGEFYWTNPLGVTFSVAGATGGSTWVHDLNTGKARQLSSGDYDEYSYSIYDPISRRYAFTTSKGLFTIGTASAQDKAVQVTTKVKRLLDFHSNSILFVNDSNTVIVQSVNDNGSLAGAALGLPALHKPNGDVSWAYAANGAWIVEWSSNGNYSSTTFTAFSGDGKATLMQPVTVANGYIDRLSDNLFLVNSPTAGLSLIDLSTPGKANLATIYVNKP